MMKKKFQFYKNIILVVASALTLVAVTFAWFSNPTGNEVSGIQNKVGTELINVYFYEADGKGGYIPLKGDIDLSGVKSGDYKQYKFIIRTNTKDPMKLNFAIEGLQTEVNDAFKDAVCIKYDLKTATQKVKNGVTTYVDGTSFDQSVGYVPLSELASDVVFDKLLQQYQTSDANYFVVYYEIGLSESAGASVQGQETSLGTVKFSAQLVG